VLQVSDHDTLAGSLAALAELRVLARLELVVRNLLLDAAEMAALGALQVNHLRIDSYLFRWAGAWRRGAWQGCCCA
jgi:hypothetical protein